MKRAFTFAEIMISLVVIAILAAVLYPTILQFTPNSNKALFKSAYNILSKALAEITNDDVNGKIFTDAEITAKNTGGVHFCEKFCAKVNTVPEGDDGAKKTCDDICADRILTTSNGMRWYFMDYNGGGVGYIKLSKFDAPYDTPISNTIKIIVDVNASNNNLTSVNKDEINNFVGAAYKLPDNPFKNGVFYYTNSANANGVYTTMPSNALPEGDFDQKKLKTQDTFEILVDINGKIVSMSPAGWANLTNESQAAD